MKTPEESVRVIRVLVYEGPPEIIKRNQMRRSGVPWRGNTKARYAGNPVVIYSNVCELGRRLLEQVVAEDEAQQADLDQAHQLAEEIEKGGDA